ncbi:hypothetical protein QQX10_06700 [Demequina sp. SYSU T00039]|uniref:Helix-turn-helix domain-containing protein n=1 Tax=Demequina lignilytica TaxID=3051663 RepID=A0AAW7M3T7_9MICO|nr:MULTISPECIES: hypothetical protein [unclassified Demequina]MDN4477946.1 hypothetical protein [Demequina sp. SYSU T00039-1]MDN4487855.1 hypothetical protein [Demequina sp. SYSU T00039]MDN4490762.1 hypothetical protein [Demequina sp. SYSU T00068]
MAAPLTDAQVVELRESYAAGARQVDLAARFGISQTAVSAIVSGRTRAAAGGPVKESAPRARRARSGSAPGPGPAGASSRRTRLTPVRVDAIRARVAAGEPRAAVAEAEGVSIHTVHSIMSGRRSGSAGSGSLTDAQVTELRAAAEAGAGQAELAVRFGISQQAVSAILRGLSHRDGQY